MAPEDTLSCRFCLGDEPSDAQKQGVLISPCACKALVHPACLKRWQGRQIALAHEEPESKACHRCEVCHAPWTVELITDAEKVLHASCWILKLEDPEATTAAIAPSPELPVRIMCVHACLFMYHQMSAHVHMELCV